MTPYQRKHNSLLFLPATPSFPSRTLERLFELKRHPSRAFNSPRALLPELQRNKEIVRCAALGTRDSVIETARHFFYVPLIFIDKKIFGTMSQNFKGLS